MRCETAPVLTNEAVAPGVFRMTVPSEGGSRAGQFYMLRSPAAATLLPRPISVCDQAEGVITFLYQVVGRGTGELAALRPGDSLELTGPLGNGFPVAELSGRIALVGGGIGAAPMLLAARSLADRADSLDCLLGFRDEPFLVDELAAAGARVSVATESGRVGTKGFVTAILNPEAYSAVLCCGPEPMMKAVANQCAAAGTPVYVSLENKMACGIGGCLVCTCTDRNGKNRRTCQDGPVFRGEEIDFDA